MKRYPVRASQGVIDWSVATRLSDFSCPWQATKPAPTEFRALHDEQRLRFRFDCVDHVVLGAVKTRKSACSAPIRVEIFLTPDLALTPYFCLEMAARGEVYGYRAETYRKFDDAFEWQGLQLEVSGEGSRYSVAGSLPLTTLRELRVLKPGTHDFFAGLYRAEFSRLPDGSVHRGWMSWVDPRTAKPDFHVASSFGVFELVD